MTDHRADEIARIRGEVDELRQRLADLALRCAGDEPTLHFTASAMTPIETLQAHLRNAAYAWSHADRG